MSTTSVGKLEDSIWDDDSGNEDHRREKNELEGNRNDLPDTGIFGYCGQCESVIPTESRTCPDCGFDVDHHNRCRFVYGITGMLLTLTVVVSPVGLSLIWLAHRHRRLAEGGITGIHESTVHEQIRHILYHHMGGRNFLNMGEDFTHEGQGGRWEHSYLPEL